MTTHDFYEQFRTVLTMNLCTVTSDPDMLQKIIEMVDISMSDFEIVKKPMEIIPANNTKPVIEYFLAAKGVSNLSMKTLKQYRYKLIHFFDRLFG